MTAPPAPRSVTGLAPVPTWKLTGISCACAAAQTGSYRSLLYGASAGACGGPMRRGGEPSTRNSQRPSTSSMRGARSRRWLGSRCTQRSRGSTTCESALLTSVVTVSLPQDHRARRRRAGAGDDERDLDPGDLVCGRAAELPDGLE